jgi:uncharacterized protein YndB with AHSA1/START domain
MPYDFTLTTVIPASPQAVYDAWLDGPGHSEMTGGAATASTEMGGAFTAWDDYIAGRNLALEPGRRILQSWRTTQFTAGDADSRIEVLLDPIAGGTKLTLHHTNVPDGHTGYEKGGWTSHYFEPMERYFKARA